MSNSELSQRVAIEVVSFDFFSQLVKNGCTADQAKAEMMKEENLNIIADRVKEIIK